MANPILGQILANAFGSAMRSRATPGPFGRTGGGLGGGLGGVALGGLLAGMMRRSGRGGGAGRGALVAMLLPFAMQWVQRNGGIGAVLDRFRQRGYTQHANSWQSVGSNETIGPEVVNEIVGRDELLQLARQFGVPEQEVSEGFAEILPEMADQLTPEGNVPPEADDALEGGRDELEKALRELSADTQRL